MLKKLYDKSKIWFAVVWIVAYCVLMSVADGLSAELGVEKSVTFPVGALLSVFLLLFLKKHGLFEEYGLCKAKTPAKKMLYYIPLAALLTANAWYGFKMNYSPLETALYILAMLCVGFLEEIIFRGLLFNGMKQSSVTAAIILSSVTFGFGHIINLINGSGAELLPNLMQVLYATAAGFMFVMIYHKTDSLIGCIAAHGIFNALSAFANEGAATEEIKILVCVVITLLAGGYAAYIALAVKKEKSNLVSEGEDDL